MSLAKEALVAVLAATWIVGLMHQFDSVSATVGYVLISLLMAGIALGDPRVLRFAARRNRRR
jgi:hypothetical protein